MTTIRTAQAIFVGAMSSGRWRAVSRDPALVRGERVARRATETLTGEKVSAAVPGRESRWFFLS